MRPAPGTGPVVLLLALLAGCTGGEVESPFRLLPGDSVPAEGLSFPGARWARVQDPGTLGWDERGLERLETWAPTVGSSAGMVVHRGLVVAAWGEVTARESSQSLRKTLVSGLVGVLVADDRIRLDATLAELDVDDHPPLTVQERQATVEDLLRSRSGVYHSAVYEFPDAKSRKPERGAHPPGEHFFYNNWDFNVLETLASEAADSPLGDAFHTRIGAPLEMEDFRPEDISAIHDGMLSERYMGNDSDFPAHIFMISARDLARFGLLYLAGGRWEGRRVLPEWWIQRSWEGLPTERDVEYGYLWWIDPDGTWFPGLPPGVPLRFGRGNRGHYLLVVPSHDLVVVNRVRTGGTGLFAQLRRRVLGSGRVRWRDFGEMLRRILAAHPATLSLESGSTSQ